MGIFTQIDVTGTIMSDHDIIELTTNIGDNDRKIENNENKEQTVTVLRQLNFHHEKVDWTIIKEILKEIPWEVLFKGLNNEECTDLFIYCIKEICMWRIPKKRKKNGNSIPRERKKTTKQDKNAEKKET